MSDVRGLPGARLLRGWVLCVALVYVSVTLLGVTTSSLGSAYLSEEPDANAPGVLVGTPRAIRLDEILRATPWLLGLMKRGDARFASPLAYPDVTLAAPTVRDVPSALLHWEAVAARAAAVLPDEMVFAAIWWSPVALVASLLPLWLTRLGGRPEIALLITSLVLLAPANHWWSLGPLGVLAPILLGAVAALVALDFWREGRARAIALCLLAVAALCVAKTTLGYAPWTIPLTAAVFLPTAAAAYMRYGRTLTLAGLGAALAAGVGLAFALAAGSDAVQVIADTAYPGARRSIGEFVGWGLLFGAPHLWILERGTTIAEGANESEVASGYLVLAAPSAVLAVGTRWRASVVRAPLLAAAAVLVACLAWVAVDWPASVGRKSFPLTLVPPDRLAQVIGFVAAVVFGLALSGWVGSPRFDRRLVAGAAGALTVVATLLGGRSLRWDALPALEVAPIVVVSLVAGAAVAVAVWRPERVWALLPLPLLAVLVVFAANPLQRGLGDLRSSVAARVVTDGGAGLAKGAYWASDDILVDALLLAQGQPSLTSQQWIGPNESAWRVLDPTGSARSVWNRGASYIRFEWAPGKPTRITAPGQDTIVVRIDPCDEALRKLGLGLVVSTAPLDEPCLAPRGSFSWGGASRWIYAVD